MSRPLTRVVAPTAAILVPFALTMTAAGTLRFWQGWLFWVAFMLCSIATGIYLRRRDPALLARRMRFGPVAESRPTQKLIVWIILAMFLGLGIISGLDHRFGWSAVPAAIVIVANLVIVTAFGFFLVVMRENTFAASTITVEPGQRVISTGPYAHVRHPMYAGAMLLVFAMPLAMGSYWALLVAVMSIPILIARIVDEERALLVELPGYDAYRHAVRYRLVPLVW
jgi:protein-S-isoprenylcysteine O-methyltransferase Ste14